MFKETLNNRESETPPERMSALFSVKETHELQLGTVMCSASSQHLTGLLKHLD